MDHRPHYWDVYWHLSDWVASGKLPIEYSSVSVLIDKTFKWHDTHSHPY